MHSKPLCNLSKDGPTQLNAYCTLVFPAAPLALRSSQFTQRAVLVQNPRPLRKRQEITCTPEKPQRERHPCQLTVCTIIDRGAASSLQPHAAAAPALHLVASVGIPVCPSPPMLPGCGRGCHPLLLRCLPDVPPIAAS